MNKRRTDDEVTRLLKDADLDLAKGLTVSDFCRKVGVAQTTYLAGESGMTPNRSIPTAAVASWRSRSSGSSGSWPSCSWINRCFRMSPKKSGDPRPAAGRRGVPGRA